MRRWWSIFVFLFGLFCPIEGFCYSYIKGNPRWQFSQMPIEWYANISSKDQWRTRDAESVRRIVEKAFKKWESVECSFLLFRYMGTTVESADRGDGLNVIQWTNALPKDSEPGAIAIGGPIWNHSGQAIEGNVWITVGERSEDSESSILSHELGHALGLGHSELDGALMSSYFVGQSKLHNDDIDALCKAYPISENVCKQRADCPNGLVCVVDRCSKCVSDGQCLSGERCSGGVCIPACSNSSDCVEEGKVCREGVCLDCQFNEECGEGFLCEKHACLKTCRNQSDCPSSLICDENSLCSPSLKNSSVKQGGANELEVGQSPNGLKHNTLGGCGCTSSLRYTFSPSFLLMFFMLFLVLQRR